MYLTWPRCWAEGVARPSMGQELGHARRVVVVVVFQEQEAAGMAPDRGWDIHSGVDGRGGRDEKHAEAGTSGGQMKLPSRSEPAPRDHPQTISWRNATASGRFDASRKSPALRPGWPFWQNSLCMGASRGPTTAPDSPSSSSAEDAGLKARRLGDEGETCPRDTKTGRLFLPATPAGPPSCEHRGAGLGVLDTRRTWGIRCEEEKKKRSPVARQTWAIFQLQISSAVAKRARSQEEEAEDGG
ncbi:hypothetical protein CC78DRAFT_603233 [Lojkania enalia]|uniref:Uncharacterized protein n=1 Tax=Lojkania enalia TaxID=147567 RepID=A0A9P4K7V3_9PLEO|nr:hypothetical protein CC78DRAFT_603233 [Didymosphaeria enalia]